jgi:predicted PurR-regulated permease PerM
MIGIGLLVLFVLFWVIFILTPSMKMSAGAVEELKKLDEDIETIKLEQNILYTEIQQYEEKLDIMDENLEKINDTKNQIAGEYGEKINVARGYDHQQLVTFLAERYSDDRIH